ncbi:MAG: hypothetical protein ACN6OB_15050 [Chryseobacterium jejuense]
MIEITNVPLKMKNIFTVENSVFAWVPNKCNIDDRVIKSQGSIMIINF